MHKKLLVITLLCSTSIVIAQRIDPSLDSFTQDIYRVAWVDGELRAGSRSYEARFDSGSVEVTPAFGQTAPRTYPLEVSLRSIRRGQHNVFLAASAHAPAPRLVDESVLYHHSDGIVERYDVRADGCKQSVVFAERPAGVGDLVVCYSVATDLECAPTERARELHFRVAEFGGIVIGVVTGIDARGRSVEGHMAFDGQQLELVLPHEFVETATYPLELDPLFGPQLNTGVSFSDQFPDIAYDAATNIYGVVFEFGGNVEIMRHDALTGARLGSTTVGSGAGSQGHAAIASINQADSFLVVWQDDGSGNGEIKCRGVRPSDGALTNPVAIAPGMPTAQLAPDVGGDAFETLDLEGLVVWQQVGVGIQGVEVTLPIGGGDPVVLGSVVTLDPSPQSANPTISKSGGSDPGNGGRYVVAWETAIGGVALIGFVGVDRDFNVLTAPAITAGGVDPVSPDVDGDGTRFLLVFQALEGATSVTSDVWSQPLEFCTGGTALCGLPAAPLANVAGDDEVEPTTAFLGPMFAVAWSDANLGSTMDYSIAITNVVPGTNQLCNSLGVTGTTTGFRNWRPVLCAKRSGGADSEDGLLSFERLQNLSGNSTLKSHRYHPFTGGSVTQVAGISGCGTGGTCSVDGAFSVGNSLFQLTLENADPTAAAAFLLFDITQAAPSSCGPCAWINPQIVSLVGVTNGEAEVPLPLPCDAGFLGFTLDAQWLVLTPGAAAPPCPMFPFASASNAIRMVMAN